jgi:hypothetical protein
MPQANNAHCAIIGRIFIALHTKTPPSDAEWAPMCASIANTSTLAPNAGGLVFTDGGAPSTAQRKQLNDAMNGRDLPIAVMSHALIPRFVNASISLFIKSIRSYSPEEFPQAIEYLQITQEERQTLTPILLELRQRMGPERLKTLTRALEAARWK